MTKYYKTATITAEPFDGSIGMMEKYGIGIKLLDINPFLDGTDSLDNLESYLRQKHSGYLITTLEGDMELDRGDMIVTGVNGEHWAVKSSIFSKTYKKLPTVSHDIAQEIELLKQSGESLTSVIGAAYQDSLVLGAKHLTTVESYILYGGGDTFITAWMKGYQVK